MKVRKLFEIKTNTNYISSEYSPWDVQILSTKLFFLYILTWFKINLWYLLFSLPIVTIPAAKASLYHSIALGLKLPQPEEIKPRSEMLKWFRQYFWLATIISIIKWLSLALILFSLFFWLSQEAWWLRAVSIVVFYVLFMWWLMNGYLLPSMIENADSGIKNIYKDAISLAFRKPFASLMFASVSTLLLVFELILFGPMVLIIPSARAIIQINGYWFLSGRLIPSFIDPEKYINHYYKEDVK